MSITHISENIKRLQVARGLSAKALGEKSGLGLATISYIRNGKLEPKSSTLLKIADALKVPVSELMRKTKPMTSLRFRTKKNLTAREKAEKEDLKIQTSQWISDYQFLEKLLDDKMEYQLSGIGESDPKKAATLVRAVLGLNQKEPIYDLPGLLTKAGIKLSLRPFSMSKTFGISLGAPDGGPAILVNDDPKIPVERQIFTIAHELGHLVLHKSSYKSSEELESDTEEPEADNFAASFLMPYEGFQEEWQQSQGLHWVKAVLRVKKIYKVSYKTVLYRLSEEYPAIKDINMRFAVEFNKLYGRDLKGHFEPEALDRVAEKEVDQLGENELIEDRFSMLVRKAYEKEDISLGRAGEMLGKDLNSMRDLARAWQEFSC